MDHGTIRQRTTGRLADGPARRGEAPLEDTDALGRLRGKRGYVRLREHVTKTARTRRVPPSSNLRGWLKPEAELGLGKVCSYEGAKPLSEMKGAVAQRLGPKWHRNALRKSFISYRLAQTRDVAAVSLEAGNSPGQIHAHCLDLVTPAAAREWFEIRPKTLSTGLLALKFK